MKNASKEIQELFYLNKANKDLSTQRLGCVAFETRESLLVHLLKSLLVIQVTFCIFTFLLLSIQQRHLQSNPARTNHTASLLFHSSHPRRKHCRKKEERSRRKDKFDTSPSPVIKRSSSRAYHRLDLSNRRKTWTTTTDKTTMMLTTETRTKHLGFWEPCRPTLRSIPRCLFALVQHGALSLTTFFSLPLFSFLFPRSAFFRQQMQVKNRSKEQRGEQVEQGKRTENKISVSFVKKKSRHQSLKETSSKQQQQPFFRLLHDLQQASSEPHSRRSSAETRGACVRPVPKTSNQK